MTFIVVVTPRFEKEFSKLDGYTQRILKAWMTKNLVNCEDPSLHGKSLSNDRSNQWRYRIGDYRLICLIDDKQLILLALSVGHRRNVYKQ